MTTTPIQCQKISFNIPSNSVIDGIIIFDETYNNIINNIGKYNTLSTLNNISNINFRLPTASTIASTTASTKASTTASTKASTTASTKASTTASTQELIPVSLYLVEPTNTSNINLVNISKILIFSNNPSTLFGGNISLTMFDNTDIKISWIIPYTIDKTIELNIPTLNNTYTSTTSPSTTSSSTTYPTTNSPFINSPFININTKKIETFRDRRTIVEPNYINYGRRANIPTVSNFTTFAHRTQFSHRTDMRDNTSDILIDDIMRMFPDITPEQLSQLVNSGIDISSFMPGINNNGTNISNKGINVNSKYKGPSTNIYQKNYKGTTNIYSPFLYYNKGTTEKFSSIVANDLKNKTNDYYRL